MTVLCSRAAASKEAEARPEAEPRPQPAAEASSSAIDGPSTSAKLASDGVGRRALALGAVLVPGAVVHGSGSWVLGDDAAAYRLLLLEGVGIGASAAGLTGIVLTGAARNLVAPLAVTTLGGAALILLSFSADLYRVAAPRGLGVPVRAAAFEGRVGYVYLWDRQFAFDHLLTHALTWRRGPLRLGLAAWHAPSQRSLRWRAEEALRVYGPQAGDTPRPGRSGSLDLRLAQMHHAYFREGFDTTTLELGLQQRLASERVVPTIRGAFAQFDLGLGLRFTHFARFDERMRDTLLLGGFGFGFYLGEGQPRAGEVLVFYDHRHDDLPGGVNLQLEVGVPGHFGSRAHYYFSEHWGLDAEAAIGSAWLLGLGVRARAQGP